MKIVIFDDLPEGGAKRVVFEQAKRLSRHHSVTYITNTLPSRFLIKKYVDKTYQFDLDLTESNGWKRPVRELSYYYKIVPTFVKISNLINRIDPDLVIVHPSRLSQAPALLKYIKQPTLYFAEEWLRLVYEPTLHPLPQSKLNSWYEQCRRNWLSKLDRSSVKIASKVICASTYVQQCIREVYNRSAEIVPLGVDGDEFLPNNNIGNHNYFLFVGGKEAINGYPLLLETMKILESTVKIKYVEFNKRQEFSVSDSQLVKLYQGAIATLCLAENEPFGLVALESMVCQVPVIAVNEAGYKDTVIDGKNGIMIERDPTQLAVAMKMIQNDDKLRSRLGESARRRAMKYFSWDRHMDKLEKILKETIG